MYAIVEIAGKQYKAEADKKIYVPRLVAEVGDQVSFDKVLLVSNGDAIQVGVPTVAGASVSVEVVNHVRADKVIVFKKKRRKGYRVKNGHRQPYTQILVKSITV